MKLSIAEKIAVLLTALVLAFFAGYYLRGTVHEDAIVISTEKTAVAAVAAAEASGTPSPSPSAALEASAPPAASEMPALETAMRAEETPSQAPEDGRLDLNTATLEQLETLPGIGPVLGQRILDYREEYGGFLTVEELLYVKGIGEKTLAKIENLVKVGE